MTPVPPLVLSALVALSPMFAAPALQAAAEERPTDPQQTVEVPVGAAVPASEAEQRITAIGDAVGIVLAADPAQIQGAMLSAVHTLADELGKGCVLSSDDLTRGEDVTRASAYTLTALGIAPPLPLEDAAFFNSEKDARQVLADLVEAAAAGGDAEAARAAATRVENRIGRVGERMIDARRSLLSGKRIEMSDDGSTLTILEGCP